MTTDFVYVPTYLFRLFDGTNAPDILAPIQLGYPNAYISASANYPGSAATLQIKTDPDPNNAPATYNFQAGDYWQLNQFGGVFSPEVLADVSYAISASAFVSEQVAAVLPTATLAVGYAVTPNLAVGASATVSVDMVPALPDAGYNVGVALAGSAQLLGALAILSATVAGSAQVDVVVQNNGLLTLGGATVLVTALHNG